MDDTSTFLADRSPMHPLLNCHHRTGLCFTDERGQSVHISHRDRLTRQRVVIFQVDDTNVKLDVGNALRLAGDIADCLENRPTYRQRNYCDIDYALNRVISVYAVMVRGEHFVNLRVNQRDTWLTRDLAGAVVQTIRSYAGTAPIEDAQMSARPMHWTSPSGG